MTEFSKADWDPYGSPVDDDYTTPETEFGYTKIRCPICLNETRWDGKTVYERSGVEMLPSDLSRISDPLRRAEKTAYGFVLCTGSQEYGVEHYLPIDYVRYLEPLVIGLVGTANTGKSTLLSAMIRELDRVGLSRYGLSAEPLDRALHRDFERERIEPLFGQGRTLSATRGAVQGVQFVDAYRVQHGDDVRPVVFFDVGGESLLLDTPEHTRFLHAVGALIFIADPRMIETTQEVDGTPGKDATFQTVLDRITRVRRDQSLGPIPAAVVVAKADMRRFDAPVERWLGRESAGPIDPDAVRAESRDVYAYLHQQGAAAWLYPVSRCKPCTLHFVSATGGSAQSGQGENAHGYYYYPRGVRPRRVLEPLAAILAMTGFIDTPGADRVGR